MAIDILNRSGMVCPEEDLHTPLSFSIAELGLNDQCELNLHLVDEADMTALHVKWMAEPGPTDVLSLPIAEVRPQWNEAAILSDFVVSPRLAHPHALSAVPSFLP